MQVTADDGRVYLPKQYRDRLGSTFELIDRGDRLVLIPVPDDPLEALRDEWSGSDTTFDELVEAGEREAADLAGR